MTRQAAGIGKMTRLAVMIGLVLAILLAPPLLVPATADAAALPANHADFVARVVALTNAERSKVGLSALTTNAALTRAAQGYAATLADNPGCFGHTCGSSLTQRLGRAGYTSPRAWGENIAWGYTTPEAVVAAWMGSSGHRANILSRNFKEIGVGLTSSTVASTKGRLYWVQNFGAR